MKKTLTGLIAAALLTAGGNAPAQTFGVDVQVSSGKRTPTVEQLRVILNGGDLVRDVLGWQKVDKRCDLAGNPGAMIDIPAPMQTLYDNVAAAGGRNFVTLAFNNKFCGQTSSGGGDTFPNTPRLIEEFAAYAAAVVKQVPSLAGVSIWNELNGTWNGGYKSRDAKLKAYCRLSNAVIAEVRRVNPTLPIAIGASVGPDIDKWFIDMFDTYGCVGRGDQTIWLDVHPYLSGKIIKPLHELDWTVFRGSISSIRDRGISNPLAATEWGARSGYLWANSHPNGSYMRMFRNQVLEYDRNWAIATWYEMLYDKATPNAGLFDFSGNLTQLGGQYVAEFRH